MNNPNYEFMYPKSPYYRFYTHQLSQFGPSPRERTDFNRKTGGTTKVKVEGTVEGVAVGAMSEFVRDELR